MGIRIFIFENKNSNTRWTFLNESLDFNDNNKIQGYHSHLIFFETINYINKSFPKNNEKHKHLPSNEANFQH